MNQVWVRVWHLPSAQQHVTNAGVVRVQHDRNTAAGGEPRCLIFWRTDPVPVAVQLAETQFLIKTASRLIVPNHLEITRSSTL